jgi:uncharacterized damage-inducible protein DinB
MNSGQAFIGRSRHYLSGDYLPKIRRCVDNLSTEEIWWRPNDASNSVGNLVLHLAGNVRQWVVSGVGGEGDDRRRQEEFDQRGGLSGPELLDHLGKALSDADQVLAELPVSELSATLEIQGMEVSVLDALYHVVEHFSMHTGQIIYLSKLRSGRDLGFWEVKDGKATPKW